MRASNTFTMSGYDEVGQNVNLDNTPGTQESNRYIISFLYLMIGWVNICIQ